MPFTLIFFLWVQINRSSEMYKYISINNCEMYLYVGLVPPNSSEADEDTVIMKQQFDVSREISSRRREQMTNIPN